MSAKLYIGIVGKGDSEESFNLFTSLALKVYVTVKAIFETFIIVVIRSQSKNE